MKLIAGIVIGSAAAAGLMFVVACWRTLREADEAGREAFAASPPPPPDLMFVANLVDFPLWETELAKEQS